MVNVTSVVNKNGRASMLQKEKKNLTEAGNIE